MSMLEALLTTALLFALAEAGLEGFRAHKQAKFSAYGRLARRVILAGLILRLLLTDGHPLSEALLAFVVAALTPLIFQEGDPFRRTLLFFFQYGVFFAALLSAAVLLQTTSVFLLGGTFAVAALMLWVLFEFLHFRLISKLFRLVPYEHRMDAEALGAPETLLKNVRLATGGKIDLGPNAVMLGVFSRKRLFVFPGLLSRLTHEQTKAILAHEVAHARQAHLPQRLGLSVLYFIAAFLVAHLTLNTAAFEGVEAYVGCFAALYILTSVFVVILIRVLHAQEYAADAYAARRGLRSALSSALVAIGSHEVAPPFYTRWRGTHPSLKDRLRRLDTRVEA